MADTYLPFSATFWCAPPSFHHLGQMRERGCLKEKDLRLNAWYGYKPLSGTYIGLSLSGTNKAYEGHGMGPEGLQPGRFRQLAQKLDQIPIVFSCYAYFPYHIRQHLVISKFPVRCHTLRLLLPSPYEIILFPKAMLSVGCVRHMQ